jgi:hypothetical protein
MFLTPLKIFLVESSWKTWEGRKRKLAFARERKGRISKTNKVNCQLCWSRFSCRTPERVVSAATIVEYIPNPVQAGTPQDRTKGNRTPRHQID